MSKISINIHEMKFNLFDKALDIREIGNGSITIEGKVFSGDDDVKCSRFTLAGESYFNTYIFLLLVDDVIKYWATKNSKKWNSVKQFMG